MNYIPHTIEDTNNFIDDKLTSQSGEDQKADGVIDGTQNELVTSLRNLGHSRIVDSYDNVEKLRDDVEKGTINSLFALRIDKSHDLKFLNLGSWSVFYNEIKMQVDKIFKDVPGYKFYGFNSVEFFIGVNLDFSPKGKLDFNQGNTLETAIKSLESGIKLSSRKKYPYPIHFHIGKVGNIEEKENFVKYAIVVLMKAKKNSFDGKRGVVEFDKKLYEKYREDDLKYRRTIGLINHGIENDSFISFYQPILDAHSGEIVSVEALAREEFFGRVLGPNFFIEIAEEYGFIREITKIFLNNLFKEMSGYKIPFSMNLSVKDFQDDEIIDYILEQSDYYEISHSRITIEVLERDKSINEDVVAKINLLKEKGFQFSLDDFGSGYSNIRMLQELGATFDKIKLDGSLLDEVVFDEEKSKEMSDVEKEITLTELDSKLTDIIKLISKIAGKVVCEKIDSQEKQDFVVNIFKRIEKEIRVEYEGYKTKLNKLNPKSESDLKLIKRKLGEIEEKLNKIGKVYVQGFLHSQPLSLNELVEKYGDKI